MDFGDVVSFDTTYLTNKYDMRFAPFVGVNHHGQSILLGCGLLSLEDTSTFTWLFQCLLWCMGNRAPDGIITDQCKAMKNAIASCISQHQTSVVFVAHHEESPKKIRWIDNLQDHKAWFETIGLRVHLHYWFWGRLGIIHIQVFLTK